MRTDKKRLKSHSGVALLPIEWICIKILFLDFENCSIVINRHLLWSFGGRGNHHKIWMSTKSLLRSFFMWIDWKHYEINQLFLVFNHWKHLTEAKYEGEKYLQFIQRLKWVSEILFRKRPLEAKKHDRTKIIPNAVFVSPKENVEMK